MKNEEKLTKMEIVAGAVALLWPALFAVLASAVCGCKSIDVTRHPDSIATWTDTNGVVRAILDESGKPIRLNGGWEVEYFQHWTWTKLDSLNASAGAGVTLSLNGYESGADSNLVALVKTSFDGAALLAAKIGAAIASGGTSLAGDAAQSALSAAIKRYLLNGGSAAAAKIDCANGSCTISDGTVSETCANCFDSN